jgi:hypothetical protein
MGVDEEISRLEQARRRVEQGQGQQGGGQQQGQGEGQQQASGSDAGAQPGGQGSFDEGRSGNGSDAGWGSTNLDSGPGGADAARSEFKKRVGDRTSNDTAEYHRIYAPRRTTVSAKDETTPFQVGEGAALGKIEVRGEPVPEDRRYVPYEQAPRPYKTATEESLERAPIPREYRDAVRKYFDDEE